MKLPKWLLINLHKIFVQGPLNLIGKPIYGTLISIELAFQRFLVNWEMSRGNFYKSEGIEDLTIIIKTFERPQVIRRLIRSIKKQYPDVKIIVADDSLKPQPIEDVEFMALPYNQGATVGRNEALSRVKTKYFLLLDDDFVFYRRTRLAPVLSILESQTQIDIIGGEVVDLPFFTVGDYKNARLFPTDVKATMPAGSKVAGLPVYDMVANFFIGRTERVKMIGWDPNLKNLAHADFFTRAKGKLTTVYFHDLKVLHARTPYDAGYMKERNDVTFDRAILLYRYDHQKPESQKGQSQSKSN